MGGGKAYSIVLAILLCSAAAAGGVESLERDSKSLRSVVSGASSVLDSVDSAFGMALDKSGFVEDIYKVSTANLMLGIFFLDGYEEGTDSGIWVGTHYRGNNKDAASVENRISRSWDDIRAAKEAKAAAEEICKSLQIPLRAAECAAKTKEMMQRSAEGNKKALEAALIAEEAVERQFTLLECKGIGLAGYEGEAYGEYASIVEQWNSVESTQSEYYEFFGAVESYGGATLAPVGAEVEFRLGSFDFASNALLCAVMPPACIGLGVVGLADGAGFFYKIKDFPRMYHSSYNTLVGRFSKKGVAKMLETLERLESAETKMENDYEIAKKNADAALAVAEDNNKLMVREGLGIVSLRHYEAIAEKRATPSYRAIGSRLSAFSAEQSRLSAMGGYADNVKASCSGCGCGVHHYLAIATSGMVKVDDNARSLALEQARAIGEASELRALGQRRCDEIESSIMHMAKGSDVQFVLDLHERIKNSCEHGRKSVSIGDAIEKYAEAMEWAHDLGCASSNDAQCLATSAEDAELGLGLLRELLSLGEKDGLSLGYEGMRLKTLEERLKGAGSLPPILALSQIRGISRESVSLREAVYAKAFLEYGERLSKKREIAMAMVQRAMELAAAGEYGVSPAGIHAAKISSYGRYFVNGRLDEVSAIGMMKEMEAYYDKVVSGLSSLVPNESLLTLMARYEFENPPECNAEVATEYVITAVNPFGFSFDGGAVSVGAIPPTGALSGGYSARWANGAIKLVLPSIPAGSRADARLSGSAVPLRCGEAIEAVELVTETKIVGRISRAFTAAAFLEAARIQFKREGILDAYVVGGLPGDTLITGDGISVMMNRLHGDGEAVVAYAGTSPLIVGYGDPIVVGKNGNYVEYLLPISLYCKSEYPNVVFEKDVLFAPHEIKGISEGKVERVGNSVLRVSGVSCGPYKAISLGFTLKDIEKSAKDAILSLEMRAAALGDPVMDARILSLKSRSDYENVLLDALEIGNEMDKLVLEKAVRDAENAKQEICRSSLHGRLEMIERMEREGMLTADEGSALEVGKTNPECEPALRGMEALIGQIGQRAADRKTGLGKRVFEITEGAVLLSRFGQPYPAAESLVADWESALAQYSVGDHYSFFKSAKDVEGRIGSVEEGLESRANTVLEPFMAFKGIPEAEALAYRLGTACDADVGFDAGVEVGLGGCEEYPLMLDALKKSFSDASGIAVGGGIASLKALSEKGYSVDSLILEYDKLINGMESKIDGARHLAIDELRQVKVLVEESGDYSQNGMIESAIVAEKSGEYTKSLIYSRHARASLRAVGPSGMTALLTGGGGMALLIILGLGAFIAIRMRKPKTVESRALKVIRRIETTRQNSERM